jgi:hypothetical protein
LGRFLFDDHGDAPPWRVIGISLVADQHNMGIEVPGRNRAEWQHLERARDPAGRHVLERSISDSRDIGSVTRSATSVIRARC